MSQTIAPLLAAFTLPTIAVIVTSTTHPSWQGPVLAWLAVSTGLLLASYLFGIGALFIDRTPWNEIRALLAYGGLLSLTIAIELLIASSNVLAGPGFIVAICLLAAGVVMPTGWNLALWARQLRDNRNFKREFRFMAAAIDRNADIQINPIDNQMVVRIPLAAPVAKYWGRRYKEKAEGRGLSVQVDTNSAQIRIRLKADAGTERTDILATMDAALTLIAETDGFKPQSPTTVSAEATVRQWWEHHRSNGDPTLVPKR